MFDRALLKNNAKQALKRFYGLALVAALIIGAISGVSSRFTAKTPVDAGDTQALTTSITEAISDPNGVDSEAIGEAIAEYNESVTQNSAAIATSVFSIGGLIGLAITLFVTYQLEVGYKRFFLNARENPANIADLFWTYKHNLGTTMGTLLCRDIYIVLWSLLLVIPGIIKGYEYSMVPYLLAENPNMSHNRAFKLSKAMTKGHKWDLFVLDLSFIGWTILGILCCCIGTFFLAPYIQATKAEAYTFLKARALENGDATADEFPGFAALNA